MAILVGVSATLRADSDMTPPTLLLLCNVILGEQDPPLREGLCAGLELLLEAVDLRWRAGEELLLDIRDEPLLTGCVLPLACLPLVFGGVAAITASGNFLIFGVFAICLFSAISVSCNCCSSNAFSTLVALTGFDSRCGEPACARRKLLIAVNAATRSSNSSGSHEDFC
jgi:hypothetical protein